MTSMPTGRRHIAIPRPSKATASPSAPSSEGPKPEAASTGIIAVDLDGTLAHYDRWHEDGRIGDPIPAMAERVRNWLAEGRIVWIFTSRLAREDQRGESVAKAREYIAAWTLQHFGQELHATAEKDYRITELWDDRAVAVERNTGRVLGGGVV